MWKTKEWWPFNWMYFVLFQTKLFGFSLTLNIYQIDLQIAWFGFNIDLYCIWSKWSEKRKKEKKESEAIYNSLKELYTDTKTDKEIMKLAIFLNKQIKESSAKLAEELKKEFGKQ